MKPAALAAFALVLGCSVASVSQASRTSIQEPELQIKMPSRGSFAGTVADGVAVGVYANGDRYKGQWKDGKPDGVGTMSYALGGAYEGEWKNGRREGKGVMTFAGSGQRAELRFADDRRVDVAAESPSGATASDKYFLLSSDRVTGSNIRSKVAYGPLPLDQGFDELTLDQQRFVRSYYPALDAGDNPPYPLKGGKEMYNLLVYLGRYLESKDDILIYVDVDKAGEVTQVTAMSPLDERSRRLIATAAGLLKYKPAQCGGQSCPGVVPFNLRLSTRF